MSDRSQRSSYFVDKTVQGALLRRAARYWVLSLLVVGALTVLGWMFISPGMPILVKLRHELPSLAGGFAVAIAVSMLVLPVILYDLAKLSNRFAGPMLRLRRGMLEAAAGEHVEAIHFRDHDYWQEFADAFNELNERVQKQDLALQELEFGAKVELAAAE